MNRSDIHRPSRLNSILRFLIALFQLFGGSVGLFYALTMSSFSDLKTALVWLVLMIAASLPILAGCLLLLKKRAGILLTIIAQGLQIPGIVSYYFTFVVSTGASVKIFLSLMNSTRINIGMQSRFGPELGFGVLYSIPSLPDFTISINLVACLVLFLTLKWLRK